MIGGTIFSHNCVNLDYTLEQSIDSLLAVCDEVICIDAESTDGTIDLLLSVKARSDRFALYSALWTPIPDWKGRWLADLANTARKKLKADYHIALQADEVLHEDYYDRIKEFASTGKQFYLNRLNFWKDAQHLVPPGKVCGHNISRMGPKEIPFVGDAESLALDQGPVHQSNIPIFHYGFLRKTEAQIAKGIAMESAFCGTYNPIYDAMKASGSRQQYDDATEITGELLDYSGLHPASMHEWLLERGYNPCPQASA